MTERVKANTLQRPVRNLAARAIRVQHRAPVRARRTVLDHQAHVAPLPVAPAPLAHVVAGRGGEPVVGGLAHASFLIVMLSMSIFMEVDSS